MYRQKMIYLKEMHLEIHTSLTLICSLKHSKLSSPRDKRGRERKLEEDDEADNTMPNIWDWYLTLQMHPSEFLVTLLAS